MYEYKYLNFVPLILCTLKIAEDVSVL
jgi:hypothetical protein